MRRSLAPLAWVVLLANVCAAQNVRVYTIDTVAGGALYDNRPATATPLSSPAGLLVDRNGALWIADAANRVIRRVNPVTGEMTIAAGGGTLLDDAALVPARQVQLDRPSHLAQDADGNIFFSDLGQYRVRRLTADGLVSTVVGNGEPGFSGDGGPARLARLGEPRGLAFDSAGNLYVGEGPCGRIRRIDRTGNISSYAGTGGCGESGNGGAAINAALGSVQGLAFDSADNLFFVTEKSIRRIDRATGVIGYVIGNGIANCTPLPDERPPLQRGLCGGHSLAIDAAGILYFNSDGAMKLADGVFTQLTGPAGAQNTGLALDGQGNLFVAYRELGLVRRVAIAEPLREVVVAGTTNGFDGPALQAVLAPAGVALDTAGNVYIAERRRDRVRRFNPATGEISTIVGGGTQQAADGLLATSVNLGLGGDIFVDRQGNILLSDVTALWRVDAQTGRISRVAGAAFSSRPNRVHSGDGGPARDATFGRVDGIVMDAAGNIFVGDSLEHRVRRIDAATGIINTIAGNGTSAYSGDGGQATAAALGSPSGLAFDRDGNLLICGGGRPVVRRVNLTTGVITTLQARTAIGSPLAIAEFPGSGGPRMVSLDRDGNILVLFGTVMIQRIRASDGLLQTIAGSTAGFFGDGGLATLARIRTLAGSFALDANDNIYLGDGDNGRLRKLTLNLPRPSMIVSPSAVSFVQGQGNTSLLAQSISVSSQDLLAYNWTLAISISGGGSWLTATSTSGVSPGSVLLLADASQLAAGTYRAMVTIRSTEAENSPRTVDVVLTVQGSTGAVLGLSQQFVSFQAVQGTASPPPQTVVVSNTGSGTLTFTVSATTSAGGTWLRVSPAQGTAPATLTVSAETSGLAQGTYQGQVLVRNSASGETQTISVVLAVTRTQPILLPAQTGFLFVGVEGSLVIGPQSFAIQNAGQGSMNWQIQTSLPAGGDWLRVTPLQGTSNAAPAVPPQVTLQVDPSRLRAGVSVALLTITATQSGLPALNSPQTAIVLVNMLPRGSAPISTTSPLGLIFTAQAGGTGALAQSVTVASTGGQALQFLARTQTRAGGNWLTVTPEQGALLGSSESAVFTVQARPSGLAAGVYFGSLTLSFNTGVTQEVAVALVVASPGTTSITKGLPGSSGLSACTPRRQVVVETRLGNRFSTTVGWPAPMLAEVVDDCGTAVTNATVTAGFTGGDPNLPLQSLRNGQYAGTWVPASRGSVGITLRAVAAGLEDGVTQFAGNIGQDSSAAVLPLVFRDGWVNAASFERFRPLAPGMIFSLFGSNLAEGRNSASELPLPRALGQIRVSLGGVDIPLFYSDSGQVNAQVPYELAAMNSASLVVSGRGSAGAPAQVAIAAAQPGIFTMSQSGTGQGVIVDANNRVVDSNNPIAPGDVVVIYATGLGPTVPPVATGASAPISPLARVSTPVTVAIGGRTATVEFAGLTPNFAGLYQVNARVPTDVTRGSAVPVVITQNGVNSNTVTIAIR